MSLCPNQALSQRLSGERSHHYPCTYNNGSLHQGNKTINVFSQENATTQILRSLHGIPKRDRLMARKARRTKGTCEWLMSCPEYLNWVNDKNVRILRISGGPGKGKTMLAIYLLDQLRRAKTEDEDIIYFFCEYGDDTRNKIGVIQRDLCNQLLTLQKTGQQERLIQHINQYFTPSSNRNDPPVCNTTFVTILETLIRHCDRSVTCLIDGLDECDANEADLEQFLELLQGLTNNQPDQTSACNFRVLVVSRFKTMSNHMDHQLLASASIDLDSGDPDDKVRRDVRRYIAEKVNRETQLSAPSKNELRRVFEQRSGQTFLWVGYVWQEIKGRTWQEMQMIFQSIPPGLDSIYTRILGQIKTRWGHGGMERVVRVLKWAVLSQRPLTLEEMAIAARFSESEEQSPQDQLQDILTSCGYLFHNDGTRVRLLHQSAIEFLQNREKLGQNLELFYVDRYEGHTEATRFCLAHVQRMFQHSNLDTSEAAFLDYATRYWPGHAKFVAKPYEDIFDLKDSFWKKRSIVRERWWGSYWGKSLGLQHTMLRMSRRYKLIRFLAGWRRKCILPLDVLPSIEDAPSELTPMHLAAYFDIDALASVLIDANNSVNVRDSLNRTPLLYAAQMGQMRLVARLLDCQSQVNASDRSGMSALHWAAMRGHQEVVSKLLDHRANIEKKEVGEGRPIGRAVDNGSKAIIKALLERGADMNHFYMLAPRLDEPLSAMERKREELARRDIDMRWSRRWGFLSIFGITSPGKLLIIQTVLAMPTLLDPDFRGLGIQPICRLLLANLFVWRSVSYLTSQLWTFAHESRTLYLNSRLRSPLSRAVEKGDRAIVELLLQHGARPEFGEGLESSALELAEKKGDIAMQDLLKRRMASQEPQGICERIRYKWSAYMETSFKELKAKLRLND